MSRGYFGIGVYGNKFSSNLGTLLRSANILGASFVFTVGARYDRQATDTMKTFRHLPTFWYANSDDFFSHLPMNCPVVAIEMSDNSYPLERYCHRERCIYLLGPEDGSIPDDVLSRCTETVRIFGEHCYNVSVAGSIVMYDRYVKSIS